MDLTTVCLTSVGGEEEAQQLIRMWKRKKNKDVLLSISNVGKYNFKCLYKNTPKIVHVHTVFLLAGHSEAHSAWISSKRQEKKKNWNEWNCCCNNQTYLLVLHHLFNSHYLSHILSIVNIKRILWFIPSMDEVVTIQSDSRGAGRGQTVTQSITTTAKPITVLHKWMSVGRSPVPGQF